MMADIWPDVSIIRSEAVIKTKTDSTSDHIYFVLPDQSPVFVTGKHFVLC